MRLPADVGTASHTLRAPPRANVPDQSDRLREVDPYAEVSNLVVAAGFCSHESPLACGTSDLELSPEGFDAVGEPSDPRALA